MSSSTQNTDGTDAIDHRLRAGRPQVGSALAELQARVVASVVHKRPTRVGRYQLGSPIGSGNFGTVFEAKDAELDRMVAVKLVTVRSASEIARVVREAQLLASLSHPNVVSVFETGVTDDDPPSPYLVMELVEGHSVRDWLAQERRPWHEVVEVMLQAARGLEAAHRAGIVHRDFKPDNALLGADGRVRVVDFGLARTVDDPSSTIRTDRPLGSDTVHTPTGGALGTPAYMAPEAFAGEVTPRGDQYSLCVTLYEGLFGKRPFTATTLGELTATLRGNEPSLPRNRRGVPPPIGAAVLRGLARRPEERFADLDQLVAALEAGLRPRRSRWWLGAALGAGGLLAAGLAGSRAERPETTPVAAAESSPDPSLDPSLDPNLDPNLDPSLDPNLDPSLAKLATRTTELEGLVATAKLDAALELSQSLLDRARAVEHGPTLAQVLLLRGRALSLATDYEHAIPIINEAYFLAQDHDLPLLMAHAASELVGLWGYQADEYEDAHRWKGHAEVAFERAGADPRQHPPYMSSVAGLMSRERDTAGAIEVLREALGHLERSDRANRSIHASILRQLAKELYTSGEAEEAIAVLRRAIPMFAANDGPRSPTLAAAVDNLGVFLTRQGRFDEALLQHERALEIREAILDSTHLDLGRSYGNMGRVLGKLGRHEQGLHYLDRSIELFTNRLGAGNSAVAMGHELKGEIYEAKGAQGRQEALREYERAARIYDGAGVIYVPTAERVRAAIEALGGTPPPKPSVPIPPEP